MGPQKEPTKWLNKLFLEWVIRVSLNHIIALVQKLQQLCLLLELHQLGSAINGASMSIFLDMLNAFSDVKLVTFIFILTICCFMLIELFIFLPPFPPIYPLFQKVMNNWHQPWILNQNGSDWRSRCQRENDFSSRGVQDTPRNRWHIQLRNCINIFQPFLMYLFLREKGHCLYDRSDGPWSLQQDYPHI